MHRNHEADILIVDDAPANIGILSAMLNQAGYKVRTAATGMCALQVVADTTPDLVLMDIDMPGMDGYEACRRLKADERFASIPVVFLSGLSKTEDKVKAFAAGGVDYVTKPFQLEEVTARVQTHLGISRMQRQLECQFGELKKLEEMRDSLTHMIVHDLRSPLSGVLAYLELMEMDARQQKPASEKDVRSAIGGVDTLLRMINSLLDVNKMEAGEMPVDPEDADLVATAREALDALGGLPGDRKVVVDEAGPVHCRFDPRLIVRVIENLLGNAFRYSPETSDVAIRVHARDGSARVEVHDAGAGIPDEYRERIFEKFGRVKSADPRQSYSTGLGLTFCSLAVKAHGGAIGVNSSLGAGSVFWFELPRAG